MILGAFGVVMLVSVAGRGGAPRSPRTRGWTRRSPLLAGLLTLFLLSMAGIPPTAGFIAKVSVFRAAIDAGHWELALDRRARERGRGVLLPPGDGADVHAGAGRATTSPTTRSCRASRSRSRPLATLLLGVFPGLVTELPGQGGGDPMVRQAARVGR